MNKLIEILKDGGIAILKTDTLYGIVGLAENPHTVDRIYEIKNRNPLKPVVVLLSDISELSQFGIHVDADLQSILDVYWPGKVSIVLETSSSIDLHHIHKGTGGVAFRVPDDAMLRDILRQTGPLVAPSANPEGQTPAKDIGTAMDYFGDKVNFYKDDGECVNLKPSKIIKVDRVKDSVEIIRD
ncbi:MAG: L-threonylcarbamoyladenylate synthase [Minisyncoccia bacterium]